MDSVVKIRDLSRFRIPPPSVRRPTGRTPEPPLDKDLTYYQEGSRWSFDGSRILLDGYDVGRLLSETEAEIKNLLGLAGGLDDYRKRVTARARQRSQFTKFEATVEALLGKISGKLKRVYDQKTSGVRWSLENGQLILNGINVRSFLDFYRTRRSERGRKYLEGLRDKLKFLLGSDRHERIRVVVQGLFDEISKELSEEASRLLRPPSSPADLDS